MSFADRARKGLAAVEGAIAGAGATEHDMPIKDYDDRTAEEIVRKLKGFSQHELRVIAAYERKHKNRETITDKITKLTGHEPWAGYDEQNVEAVEKALRDATKENGSVRSRLRAQPQGPRRRPRSRRAPHQPLERQSHSRGCAWPGSPRMQAAGLKSALLVSIADPRRPDLKPPLTTEAGPRSM